MVHRTFSGAIASDNAIVFADSSDGSDTWAAAPLDVLDVIDHISGDPSGAAARLAALTPEQRYQQAIAYAAWCEAYDIPVAAERVAAAYTQLIREHLPLDAPASAMTQESNDDTANL